MGIYARKVATFSLLLLSKEYGFNDLFHNRNKIFEDKNREAKVFNNFK